MLTGVFKHPLYQPSTRATASQILGDDSYAEVSLSPDESRSRSSFLLLLDPATVPRRIQAGG
jgi:hypothetical protein